MKCDNSLIDDEDSDDDGHVIFIDSLEDYHIQNSKNNEDKIENDTDE